MPPAGISKKRWEGTDDHAALLVAAVRRRHAKALSAEPELAERLERYVPDFWAAYASVYGAAHARAAEALRLLETALAGWWARPEPLRRLDRERAARPDWYQRPDLVGLSLYVDLFAGTLDGVRRKLPYLKELGVNYLHLMPLLATREGPNDGGYAVADYRRVDPRLGTMDDLRALAEALHADGMLLAIDFVMNHTAREHPWAQRALAGDPDYQAFYLMFDDRTLPDLYERTLPEVFPDFAPGNFTFVPAVGKWVWTSFYDFQWDLDYRNPAVFAAMFEEMLFLFQTGADVLRLDAVPFLWKEQGTDCRNLPGAHALLRAYRALMRIAAPGVLFKAEAIVAPDEIIRYLGTGGYEGKECELAYNATLMCHLWHALASENTQLLRTALTALPPTPETAVWLNYIRCHDDIGWGLDDEDCAAVGQDGPATRRFCSDFYAGRVPGSYAEGYRFQVDRRTGEARTSGTAAALAGLQKALVEANPEAIEAALGRLRLLYGVLYAMRGAPLLYGGDEIGQLNHFAYLDDPLKAMDNRWVHRPPMDWQRAAMRHTPGTVPHRLFATLRHLAAVRAPLAPLHSRAEEHVLFTENDRLFVVERVFEGERLLLVANFAGRPERLRLAELPAPWQQQALRDVVAGETLFLTSGDLVLPPYGFGWFVPAPEARPGPPVAVPIRLPVETFWGETVFLTGTLDVLGGGDPRHAHPLDASAYPVWSTELRLPAGTCFRFHWIKKRGPHLVARSEKTYWMKAGENRIFEV
ncbi:MAG: alpha-amylase [Rhodothermaceae bacterium]|nr:MAG: alpha-amylase [Rhodothermaceae bacterium]